MATAKSSAVSKLTKEAMVAKFVKSGWNFKTAAEIVNANFDMAVRCCRTPKSVYDFIMFNA